MSVINPDARKVVRWLWLFGRTPRVHRHRWNARRVSPPVWDPSARGYLIKCSVDGCAKVHAR